MTKKGQRSEAHFGCASCEPETIRHRWGMRGGESRLVEVNKVGEGWVKRGRDEVSVVARGRGSLSKVGIGPPSSRYLVGEGGDGLCIT